MQIRLDLDTDRSAKLAETKARRQRDEAVTAACHDEIDRFCEALRGGARAILDTFAGPYRVDGMSYEFWYYSHTAGERRNDYNTRSWCGCNDGTWAGLLRQAGVERNPLFAE
jgi:hypothetical protein